MVVQGERAAGAKAVVERRRKRLKTKEQDMRMMIMSCGGWLITRVGDDDDVNTKSGKLAKGGAVCHEG